MALPQQVQDQIAAAEQLELQLSAPAEPPVQAPTEAPPHAPEPTPAPVPATPVPAPTPVHDDAAEARYRVLQGKYNSEVPVLHQQTRELSLQVQRLEAALQARQAPPEPKPAAAPVATAKDIDDFGGDMVAMVERIAHSQVSSLAVRLNNEFSALREQIASLTGTQNLTVQQQFDKDLLSAVPDWQEVDTEPQWLLWLAEAEAFTGATRQSLLTEAAQAKDARRVAAIFNAYKATKPAAPAEAPPPAPVDKSALERQVAPPRASANATPQQGTVSIWTDAAIEAFYRDVKLGKFRGRDAEYNQIEADLNAAIAEGRYRAR